MGRMQRIVVKVNVLPVDDQVLGDLWNDKDKELDKLYSE